MRVSHPDLPIQTHTHRKLPRRNRASWRNTPIPARSILWTLLATRNRRDPHLAWSSLQPRKSVIVVFYFFLFRFKMRWYFFLCCHGLHGPHGMLAHISAPLKRSTIPNKLLIWVSSSRSQLLRDNLMWSIPLDLFTSPNFELSLQQNSNIIGALFPLNRLSRGGLTVSWRLAASNADGEGPSSFKMAATASIPCRGSLQQCSFTFAWTAIMRACSTCCRNLG